MIILERTESSSRFGWFPFLFRFFYVRRKVPYILSTSPNTRAPSKGSNSNSRMSLSSKRTKGGSFTVYPKLPPMNSSCQQIVPPLSLTTRKMHGKGSAFTRRQMAKLSIARLEHWGDGFWIYANMGQQRYVFFLHIGGRGGGMMSVGKISTRPSK